MQKEPKFSNKVRSRRLRRNIKQIELAVKSGVGIATLARLESWPIRVRIETARKIATALECSVADVFPYHRGAVVNTKG